MGELWIIHQSINQSPWWIVHLSAIPSWRPLQKAVKYECKAEIRVTDSHRRLLVLQLVIQELNLDINYISCALKSVQDRLHRFQNVGEKTSFSSPELLHVKILCFIESHVFCSFKIIRNYNIAS